MAKRKQKSSYALRDYQREAKGKILLHFANTALPVTLAIAPGGGKTVTSISVAEDYLEMYPKARVLILTHGQSILKTQYADEVTRVRPKFTAKLIQTTNDFDKKSQVFIAIPQNLSRSQKIPKIDLLIVDEAHQFYFANMVQNIIELTQPKHQLLLTGTPSPMVLRGMPIIAVPLHRLIEEGMASDLSLALCPTAYRFTRSDYNIDNELKQTVKFTNNDTIKALQDVAKKLLPRHESPTWETVATKYKKIMIATRNQKHARNVKSYLERSGITVALSTSDSDKDSSRIESFRTDPSIQVLVVVNRGILGFNMLDLNVVVDMTGSQNIDRIYQLLARVVRKSPTDDKKIFIKVTSTEMSTYMGYVMCCVLGLTQKDFLLKFNGQNFHELDIPDVFSRANEEGEREGSSGPSGEHSANPIYDMAQIGIPVVGLFNKLFKGGATSFTNLNRVSNAFFNTRLVLTKEQCQADALKFRTKSSWEHGSSAHYHAAEKNGWLSECCAHMEELKKGNGYWTKERCKESAGQYSQRSDWYKKEKGAYCRAQKQGWLEECCAHMGDGGRSTWYKPAVQNDAKKYSSRTEWKKKSGSAYKAAVLNGWLEDCCAHMKTIREKWSLQKCKNIALRFQTVKEWKEKYSSCYKTAQANGWLSECCSHMNRAVKSKASPLAA